MNLIQNIIADTSILSAIRVTLILAFSATTLSSILGISLGLLLERKNFPGKALIIRLNRTLMGIPPVVVGLLVYMLLMRRGPLGPLELLFTLPGMIIAQTIIITPIICGMVYSYAVREAPAIRFFAKSMGADAKQTRQLVLQEMKQELYFSIVTGFGRSISEVGAVMLVGGNIKGKTRTMTTTISLLKSQGIFTEGIVLGAFLLLMAFVLQWLADSFQKEHREIDNY